MITRRISVLVSLGTVAAWLAVGHGQGAQPAAPASAVFSVRAFGAVGDGRTIDTPAINRAIDAAAAAGGGTVHFTAGHYLSVSIHLKSHVGLFLDHGATIVAAEPAEGVAYDPPEPNPWDAYQDFGHSHWHNSLIWGEKVEDVSITGPGRIWGRGLVRSNKVPPGGGNKAIALKLSRNVVIRDISILTGGHFAILATGVDNLTIDNLKIDTNRDGIDVDACRNVRLSNLTINSPFDDAICLKSSYALGVARATENVTVTNSQVSGYDEGTLLDGTFTRRDPKSYSHQSPTGRVKFGTESNGGFKNITISNVVFDYSRGLALETVDGGLLEDVTITNLTMRDVVNPPIFVRLGNRARGPKETTAVGKLRRVQISNVVAYNAEPRYASIISGIPGHDIEDVTLSNIRIHYKGGGTAAQAALAPPENETAYPEPVMFGEMPAYGFFIRHVSGLEMRNVRVGFAADDLRPAFVLNDVTGAEFQHVRAARAASVPTFVLRNVRDFAVHESPPVPDVRERLLKYRSY
ncbi:MAG TPA: glycoside hydrolase family 28 protein [Vicinamibacterales bacterium]|nr:glycoside hydrolase family 28 protein [Vicinamibacterales bacterium]